MDAMADNKNNLNKLDKNKHINISFICSGNTCRSYIAEAVAAYLLRTVYYTKNPSLKNKININSAGTSVVLSKVPENSFKALDMLGIPNIKLIPSQINEPLVKKSDLILVMSASHKNTIIKSFNNFDCEKIFSLKELSNIILYLETEKIYKMKSPISSKDTLIDKKVSSLKTGHGKSPSANTIKTIRGKIFSLKNINRRVPSTPDNLDIEDPFGKSIKVYCSTAKKIHENIVTVFNYLFN